MWSYVAEEVLGTTLVAAMISSHGAMPKCMPAEPSASLTRPSMKAAWAAYHCTIRQDPIKLEQIASPKISSA